MSQPNTGVLADQSQALTLYLEALLSTQSAPLEMSEPSVAPSMVCLVFSIAGLPLALPLERVSRVLDYSQCNSVDVPNQLPGQLGTIQLMESIIPVFDCAHFIMPHRVITSAYQQVVVVDNLFALACHQAGAVIEVMRETVHWRSAHTQRRWLAGMLVKQHTALLDADALAQQLIISP